MDADLKQKAEKRIKMLGMKKKFLAEKMNISQSQLSQTFSGIRDLSIEEETKMRLALSL